MSTVKSEVAAASILQLRSSQTSHKQQGMESEHCQLQACLGQCCVLVWHGVACSGGVPDKQQGTKEATLSIAKTLWYLPLSVGVTQLSGAIYDVTHQQVHGIHQLGSSKIPDKQQGTEEATWSTVNMLWYLPLSVSPA